MKNCEKAIDPAASTGSGGLPARKDKPQITFLQSRADAEAIDFRQALIEKRKETATNKLNAMLGYANNTVECRSKKLVSYFDEYSSDDCGICDVCLLRKKIELSGEEFETMMKRIQQIVSAEPLIMVNELVKQSFPFAEEKIIDTVRYLLDNDKLRYNSSQQLEWNR
jgi:ATP-dependent DNA helicase RecQ